jgi:transcriptional regulator with XRE-family HTH domain
MVQIILDRMQITSGKKTQKELADLLGVKESTISTWKERGEIPPRQLQKFAKVTGTSLDSLQNIGMNPTGSTGIGLQLQPQSRSVTEELLEQEVIRARNSEANEKVLNAKLQAENAELRRQLQLKNAEWFIPNPLDTTMVPVENHLKVKVATEKRKTRSS